MDSSAQWVLVVLELRPCALNLDQKFVESTERRILEASSLVVCCRLLLGWWCHCVICHLWLCLGWDAHMIHTAPVWGDRFLGNDTFIFTLPRVCYMHLPVFSPPDVHRGYRNTFLLCMDPTLTQTPAKVRLPRYGKIIFIQRLQKVVCTPKNVWTSLLKFNKPFSQKHLYFLVYYLKSNLMLSLIFDPGISVQNHCCILSWVELLCPVQPQIYQHIHTHTGVVACSMNQTHTHTLTNLEKAFLLTAVWFPLLYFLFSFFSLCLSLPDTCV